MHPDNIGQQFGALFHGTPHEFKPGDHITPQGEEPYAFATPDLQYATEHADRREAFEYSKATRDGRPESHAAAAGITGRVYRVEPLSDDARRHEDNTDAVVSTIGFRVLGEHK